MMNAMPQRPQQIPQPLQQMSGAMGSASFPYGGQPPLPLLQQPYDPIINRVQNRTIASRDDFGLLETRNPPRERTLDHVVGQVADQVARNQLTSYEMYQLTPVEDEKGGGGNIGSAGKRIRALRRKKTWLRVLVVQQLIPQESIAKAIHDLEEDGTTVAKKMKEIDINQQVQISNILNDNIQSKVNSHFVWQIAQLGFQFERKWGKKTMSNITLYLKHTPRPDVECVAIIRQREQAKLQQARQSMGFPPQLIPRPGVSFGPPPIQAQPMGAPPMVKKAETPSVVPPRGIRVPTSDSTDSSDDSDDSVSTPPSISTRPSTVSTGQSRSRSSRSRHSTKSGSRGHGRSRSRERISRDRREFYSPPRSGNHVVVERREKDRYSRPRRRPGSPYPSRLSRRPWPENEFYEHDSLVDRFGRTSNRALRTDLPWVGFNHRRHSYSDAPSLSGSTLRGSTVPSLSMSGSTRARPDDFRPSWSSRESGDERRRRYEEEKQDMIARLVEDELQELHRQRVHTVQRPAPFQGFTGRVHIRDLEGGVPQDYFPDRRHSSISHWRDSYKSDSENELYYRRDDPDHFRPRREHYTSGLDGEEYDFIGRDEANPFRHAVRGELDQFRPRRELHKTTPHGDDDDDEYIFIGRDGVNPFRRRVTSSQHTEQAPRSHTPKSILKVSKQSEHKISPPSNSPNHIQPSPRPSNYSATQDLSARERLYLPAITSVYSQLPTQPLPERGHAQFHAKSSPRLSTPSNSCREVILYRPPPKPRRQKQRARFEDVAEKRPRRVSFKTEDQSGVHMWTRAPTVRPSSRPHIIIRNSAPPVLQHRKPNTTPSESGALASGRERTLYSPSGLKRRKATWTTPPYDAHPIPSWPLDSVTVGSFTNSSGTSLRYRPTTSFSSSQPSTQEPCHCQSDGGDGAPPHQNSASPSLRSKTVGYCFSLCLFLFLIIGIFAACVQAIAVFLLLEEQAAVDYKPPTWRDNDYFQMLSGSCWQILGMAFTLLITLKHTSEHKDHRSWIFPWLVGFVCFLCSAFAMALYVRSPAWSLATSGCSSLAQVSVHFLTIRIMEKTEIREKRTLQWQARDKVDEDLEQHKVKCRIRKAELDHEMFSYQRSLEERRATVLRDVEKEEMSCKLTRQRLADEETERRKKVMDEIVQLERQKAVLELDLQRGRQLRPPGSDSGFGSASIYGASVTDDARSTGGDSSDDRCEMLGGRTPDMVGEETFGAGIRVHAVNV